MQSRLLTTLLIVLLLSASWSGTVIAATIEIPTLQLRFHDPEGTYRLVEGSAGIDTGMHYQAQLTGGRVLFTLQARPAAEGSARVPTAQAMKSDIAELANGGIPGITGELSITHGDPVPCSLGGIPCRAAPLALGMRGRRADAALIATTHQGQHLALFAIGPGSHDLATLTARFSPTSVSAESAQSSLQSPPVLLGMALLLAVILGWIIRGLVRRGTDRH